MKMSAPVIHDVRQGTPEWEALRAGRFTASQAPAMMGASLYMSRSQLLEELVTGKREIVTPAKQALFDRGHAAEAAALPNAEAELGMDLYPVTVTREVDGLPLLASVDGASICMSLLWENKLRNAALAGQIERGELEPHYYWQLEHQLLTTGASAVLFTAATDDGDISAHMTYLSCPERREMLVRGWKQFALDAADYTPPELAAAVTGTAPDRLPVLHVELSGMVTASNLDEFREHALAVISDINTDLVTDQDFADAEETVKFCGAAEKQLVDVKERALAQTESIDRLFRTVDELSASLRDKRLELNRLVTSRKKAIRDEIAATANAAIADYRAGIESRISPARLPAIPHDVAGAMKGKRTMATLQGAADDEVARYKIAASAAADNISASLAIIRDAEHPQLFADIATLALQPADQVRDLVAARIAKYQADEVLRVQAERERIRQEELQRIRDEEAAVERQKVAEGHLAHIKGASIKDGSIEPATREPSRPTLAAIADIVAGHHRVPAATAMRWIIELARDAAA